MYARHKLKTRGYVVMYAAVQDHIADYMRSLSRDDQNFWIHETWDGALHDEQRFRAFVPDAPAREISLELQRFYKTFVPDASTTEWHFLKTAGGAPDQLARRTFLPVPPGPEALNVSAIPASLFIATQDGTYFYGYGWNNHVALKSSQQLIELNKGDIVIFRGDYMYAGAGGEANNVLVHTYLDTPHFARLQYQPPEIMEVLDDTRDVDEVFCFVWKCPFIAGTKCSLHKHLNRYHGFHFNHPRDATTTMP
jgi:hypothetical protein